MPPSHTDEGLRAAVEARRRLAGTTILMLSQYVEVSYAADLLADRAGGVGYLLKDRVADVDELTDALRRVAAGGTVLDPQVVAQLFAARRDPLASLTPREREVLGLSAYECNLTLVPSTDNRVHVRGTAFSSFPAPRLHWSTSVSAIALCLTCAPLPRSCSLRARIAVPPEVRVTAADRSVSISASALRAPAYLSTSARDVEVSDVSRDLNLASISSSVIGSACFPKSP